MHNQNRKAGVRLVVLLCCSLMVSIPALCQGTHPVDGTMEVFCKVGSIYHRTFTTFPASVYLTINTEWCSDWFEHKVHGKKYDHAHLPCGFPIWDSNQALWVSVDMADAGWDNH